MLEIGTGSGYQAAVLREMGLEVFTIERAGIVRGRTGLFPGRKPGDPHEAQRWDLGLACPGPFDRIIVTAGGPNYRAAS